MSVDAEAAIAEFKVERSKELAQAFKRCGVREDNAGEYAKRFIASYTAGLRRILEIDQIIESQKNAQRIAAKKKAIVSRRFYRKDEGGE